MAMTKVKNLQLWCKKMVDGYRDVEVRDMAASWKSGLAFCAIIHRFRPDLIDYESLSKENVFENNDLAYEVALKELSIPAFLEAADMVAIRVPDRLSVITYVSQYYNYFHNKPQLGGPGVNKFVSPSKKKDNKALVNPAEIKSSLTPTHRKDGNTEIKKDRQESIGDKCSICHEKVYLVERHIENAKLYHRTCFRNSDQSPQSKVFKRQPYSTIAEQNESQSTKYRKIDTDTKKDVSEKKETRPDFLKKCSDGKSTGEELTKTGQKFDTNTKSHIGLSDVTSWKTADKGTNIKTEKASAFPKTDLRDRFGATANKADERKPKTGNLLNKFKELDERNLKALNESSTNKPSEQNKLSEKPLVTSTANESAKQFPVPKPRHNIGKAFEKMDTSETTGHRNPVAHKWDTPSSSGSGSKSKDIKSTVSQETKKSDFTRPKTPPNSHKSEFSLNITIDSNKDKSSSSPPPPLPACSPPRLPASQPPTLPSSQPSKLDFSKSGGTSPRVDTKKSQVASPKSREKFNKTETEVTPRPHLHAPTKPPRLSEINERGASPMDTGERAVLSTAVVHEPSAAQSAVLVVPKRHNPDEEQKNRQVLGGLLKSLAGVRNKNDVKTGSHSNENKGLDSTSSAFSSNKTDVNVDLRLKDKNAFSANKTDEKFDLRQKDKNEGNKFGEVHLKPRPKTSFVSQNRDLFSDTKKAKDESQGKTKMVTTTKTVITTTTKTTTNSDQKSKDANKVVEKTKVTTTTDDKLKTDSDMPEWKRKLEEKKREKARPKSADLLSDKTVSSSGGMLDWQKEAEKRKDARKGAYVDPEKVRIQDRNTSNITDTVQPSRPLSPQQRTAINDFTHKHNGYKEVKDKSKSPEKSSVDQNKTKAKANIPELKPVEPNKKKILFEISTSATDKTQADASKKKIGLDQKFVFGAVELKPTPKKPARPAEPPASPTSHRPAPSRPPPPKTSPSSATKHHLTTYQIQKQLRMIDQRLTELELTGRTLEDSIRNANDEEEDELMINWFELINDKNELVRRECDLVYISRTQELEIEQEKIEQQLRNLVDKPDHLKTEADQEEQVSLLEKKVEVVYQRNNIVDSIDEDRLRYLAEDRDIEAMLQTKGFLKDGKDGKAPKKEKHMK